jgi:signal transduction histidine kinase
MERQQLIEDRNKLIIYILFPIYIIDTMFYTFVEGGWLFLWPPVGPILSIIFFTSVKFKIAPVKKMCLTIFSIYIYFLYLNIIMPDLINYLFFLFVVIVSAFYQSIRVVLHSSILTISTMIILPLYLGREMISNVSMLEFPYIILLALFITIVVMLFIKFANTLYEKANFNEKQAKLELKSTRTSLDAFFDNSNEAFAIVDPDHYVLEANHRFNTLFFTQSNEYKSYNKMISAINHKWKEAPKVLEIELTFPINQDIKILDCSFAPLINDDDQLSAYSVIIRDITEKKQMEEYVTNSEKLKTSGQMAAGIAHEIRNPLTVISGFLQVMKEQNSFRPQYFSIIHNEVERMNGILNEFLLLAKPLKIQLERKSVHHLLEDVILLYESQSKMKKVELIYENSKEEIMLECDPNQLKQAFINLLQNALEAVQDTVNGQVRISCERKHELEINIIDNGIGIPKEILEKVGTPFFTTKENGTGLGLMITQKIIGQHGGKLEIVNSNDEGTHIVIKLPILNQLLTKKS